MLFVLKMVLKGENSAILEYLPEKKKCKLKDGLSFHFLSTQTPCGDACIIDGAGTSIDDEPPIKRNKLEIPENKGDFVYTGAKLLGTHHDDVIEQVIGAVRTKPGRGERTLSMSCSDKLAKWQVMGFQGALLYTLLEAPIYFETLNFLQNDYGSLERAIWRRFVDSDYKSKIFILRKPQIHLHSLQSTDDFPYTQDESKQPSPNGLVWCNIPDFMKPYEVSVNGKRQGVTSKTIDTIHAALSVSKLRLFKVFSEIIQQHQNKLNISYDAIKNSTYANCKLISNDYQSSWSELRSKYFKQWSQKPENMLNFKISDFKFEENKKKP
ncbi:adenosine deaminase, tRNA-specific 1 isoform X2 [Haematobia irritans]|uniref:adenosine deaminase, tRNA-specific 1 isoform X2 n=1 Tax=Haematobia irritans TaxID=7368 RepID=UPI003F4FD4FF